ncbi:MAG: serine/threonine protein kinase [Anaerolineaceae bacterium]|nr:serine/threonine protein kinase [Anaerolineaceae bacterium]
MKRLSPGTVVCPYCGHDNRFSKNDVDMLSEGIVLNRRYMLGCVLGRGESGVVYTGVDLEYGERIAVKEYFPQGMCVRGEDSVQVKGLGASFRKGVASFEREAGILFRLDNRGFVHIRDHFEENGTAYIIMDHVEGADLQKVVEVSGGRLPWQHVLDLMLPLIRELKGVHENGIIHGDIKPDNIRMENEGLVLLDFGNIRDFNGGKSDTRTLAPGFTPKELYGEGRVGPWSDVYSICSVMYWAIGGVEPPSAPEREKGEPVFRFKEIGVEVPAYLERAILNGMAMEPRERPQNMDTLLKLMTDPEYTGVRTAAGTRPMQRIPDTANMAAPAYSAAPEPVYQAAPAYLSEPDYSPAVHVRKKKDNGKVQNRVGLALAALSLVGIGVLLGIVIDMKWLSGSRSADVTVPTAAAVVQATPVPVQEEVSVPTAAPSEDTGSPAASVKAGDVVRFGRYEQDEAAGADEIEWQVLAVENGRALVISKNGLDAKPYNDVQGSMMWENCSLRSWLNETFLQSAFDENERSRIHETTLSNDGGETKDMIFLLSTDEINRYFADVGSRGCEATAFAKQNGAVVSAEGKSSWWLRSQGLNSKKAASVDPQGEVNKMSNVSAGNIMVRPAFWMDL